VGKTLSRASLDCLEETVIRLKNSSFLDNRRTYWEALAQLVSSGRGLHALGLTAFTATLSWSLICLAQDSYPNRLIKIVVPFFAGTTADQIPRIIGDKLSAKWGQPVIIENKPGATGNIGAELVARAEPDGYTLLSTAAPPLAINPTLYSKLSFDASAFVPITLMTLVPNVLVVTPKTGVSSLHEFIALAKEKQGQLLYASTGPGGTPTLAMEMLKLRSGANLRDIPFRQGTGPALLDMLGGRIDAMFVNISEALPHIRSGSLKALGVTTEKRLPQLPDVPAIAETFPGFYSTTWYAMVAPPKTPTEIAAKLSATIGDILHLPDVTHRLADQSMVVVAANPAETRAFIEKETERWREVIKAAGIKLDQ
jgi:tripartite-type tricarboxylate transporter receptor subunit TctC